MESKPIPYQAFETLALHRIVDIAMSLFEADAETSSSIPTATHLSDSDEVTEARATLFADIFKGRDGWGVSTVLDSIRSDITKCINQSVLDSNSGSGVALQSGLQAASKLALSALHNKTKSEGFNALFNIEMTGALLKYILTKVYDDFLRIKGSIFNICIF